jgi:hypothetical protein
MLELRLSDLEKNTFEYWHVDSMNVTEKLYCKIGSSNAKSVENLYM